MFGTTNRPANNPLRVSFLKQDSQPSGTEHLSHIDPKHFTLDPPCLIPLPISLSPKCASRPAIAWGRECIMCFSIRAQQTHHFPNSLLSWIDPSFHSPSCPQSIISCFLMKSSSGGGVSAHDNIFHWIYFCPCPPQPIQYDEECGGGGGGCRGTTTHVISHCFSGLGQKGWGLPWQILRSEAAWLTKRAGLLILARNQSHIGKLRLDSCQTLSIYKAIIS